MPKFIVIEVSDFEMKHECFDLIQDALDHVNIHDGLSHKAIFDLKKGKIFDFVFDSGLLIEDTKVVEIEGEVKLVTTSCMICEEYYNCAVFDGRGQCPNKSYFE